MIDKLIIEFNNTIPEVSEFALKSKLDFVTSELTLKDYLIIPKKEKDVKCDFEDIVDLFDKYDIRNINFHGFLFNSEITVVDNLLFFGSYDDMFLCQNKEDKKIYLSPDMAYEELVCNKLSEFIQIVLVFGIYSILNDMNELDSYNKNLTKLKIKNILNNDQLSDRFVNSIPS